MTALGARSASPPHLDAFRVPSADMDQVRPLGNFCKQTRRLMATVARVAHPMQKSRVIGARTVLCEDAYTTGCEARLHIECAVSLDAAHVGGAVALEYSARWWACEAPARRPLPAPRQASSWPAHRLSTRAMDASSAPCASGHERLHTYTRVPLWVDTHACRSQQPLNNALAVNCDPPVH